MRILEFLISDPLGGRLARPRACGRATADTSGQLAVLPRLLAKTRSRVLVAFDHLDAVADWCARDLVLNLPQGGT